jgi:hypothetical protein
MWRGKWSRRLREKKGVEWCERIEQGRPPFIGSTRSGGTRAGGGWRWCY